ncbi:hypothetical protein ES288_D13G223100v1 [Gossypium darwinii]|uniref:Uncharacterized protein n=1 Tax=Gossypium darwinii TaxID=34276 RepID=A0A5D2A3E8_GOSDA|nr:hypothetical protein ES288_D13G223100v1 [Gossypium darwinii]
MRRSCNRTNRKLYERSSGFDYGGVNDIQVMNQPGAEGARGFGTEALHARGEGLALLQRLRLEAQRLGTWNTRLF